MHKKAAEIGGRLCIMGTNNNAVPACKKGVIAACRNAGRTEPEFIECILPEAAKALTDGNTDDFDRLLTDSALNTIRTNTVSAILLAQVTMARAKDAMIKAGISVPVLTTPEEGAKALLSAVKI